MKRAAAICILWLIFTTGCLVAPFAAIFFWAYPEKGYMRRYVKSIDRTLGALMGYSGRHTISAELAADTKHRWMARLLEIAESQHCETAAINEHLYCRIEDHEIGDK